MKDRPCFSISRQAYDVLNSWCLVRRVSMASVIDASGARATGEEPTELRRGPRPERKLPILIDIPADMDELLADLVVRARELNGVDVTKQALLEAAINAAIDAGVT